MAPRAKLPPRISASVVGEAAEIRTGDWINVGTAKDEYRKVVAVARLERGVAITYRDGLGESTKDCRETDAVAYATRLQPAGCRFLVYRVPHPLRSGIVCFVSIPED